MEQTIVWVPIATLFLMTATNQGSYQASGTLAKWWTACSEGTFLYYSHWMKEKNRWMLPYGTESTSIYNNSRYVISKFPGIFPPWRVSSLLFGALWTVRLGVSAAHSTSPGKRGPWATALVDHCWVLSNFFHILLWQSLHNIEIPRKDS